MTDRKILEIEIDDSQFKEFTEAFGKFKEELDKTPDAWANAAKWAQQTRSDFEKMVAAQNRQAQQDRDKADHRADQERGAIATAWQSITDNSKKFLAHIKGASLSLLKWTGLTSIFASILGAGGLFGISRMAAGVAATRQNASGLGISYGEQRAFSTSFGRLGNTDAMLSGFHRALTGSNERSALMAVMGPGAERRLAGKDAAGTFGESLPDIQRVLRRFSPQMIQQAVEAYHLDVLGIDPQTARLIRDMSPGELKELVDSQKNLAEKLELTPDEQRGYRNFMDQLDRAEMEVGTHFARGLVRLAPTVEKFATAAEELVDAFIKNGYLQEGIELVRKGIVWLSDQLNKGAVSRWAKEIGSAGESLDKLTSLVSGVSKIGDFLNGVNTVTTNIGKFLGHKVGADRVGGAVRSGIDAIKEYNGAKAQPNEGGAKVGHNFRYGGRSRGDREVADDLASQGMGETQLAARIQALRPHLSSQECVALAKAAVGSNASVREWRRGDNPFETEIAPGTPLSTFMDRRGRQSDRYDGGQGVGAPGNNTTHALVFDHYVKDKDGNIVGFSSWEQYRGSGGPHLKTYMRGDQRGGEKDANNYATVYDSSGKPIGRNNPQLKSMGQRQVTVDAPDSHDVTVTTRGFGALPAANSPEWAFH